MGFISEEYVDEEEEESVDQVSELPPSMFANHNRRKSSHYYSSAIWLYFKILYVIKSLIKYQIVMILSLSNICL